MKSLNVNKIHESTNELSNYITELHFEHDPSLSARYGSEGKLRCKQDAVFHLNFLAEALTMQLPEMYVNYILWAESMLKSRNIPDTDLLNNLNFVQIAIHEILGSDFSNVTKDYINIAREKLLENKEEFSSFITNENPLKDEVTMYLDYLLNGKRHEANQLIIDLISKETPIKAIYQHIFQISQYEIGRLWQCNKITVAHEHYCTAATQQIMSGLYAHIFSTNRNGKTLVACSISGELHELGIRMVTDFFEMDGWDTYYLGANMPENQLSEALKEYKADILALSVTLPTHVSKSVALIDNLKNKDEFKNLKIMVGGYPFITNPNLWKKVGADAFAQNADEAIKKANELIFQ